MNWDEYFMRMVYLVASKSKDPRTRIGSVLVRNKTVIATGYNGICRCVLDPADQDYYSKEIKERQIKPEKYFWYEHSERNAIYTAARNGISTFDSSLYTQGIPCSDCARGCIQAGIGKIIVHEQWPMNGLTDVTDNVDWRQSLKRSNTMLKEAGVVIEILTKNLGLTGFLDGEVVNV